MEDFKIMGVHQRKLPDGTVWERYDIFTTPPISGTKESIKYHIDGVKEQYEPYGYLIMDDEIVVNHSYGTTDVKLDIPIYKQMEKTNSRR